MKTVELFLAQQRGEAADLNDRQLYRVQDRLKRGLPVPEAHRLNWELQSEFRRDTILRNGPELARREARRELEIKICGDPARRFYDATGAAPMLATRGAPRLVQRGGMRRGHRGAPARRPGARRVVRAAASSSDDSSGESEPPEYRRSTFPAGLTRPICSSQRPRPMAFAVAALLVELRVKR
jgi:hypothetical protein